MNYKTTAKNEVLGEGKTLSWAERAGVFFIGDEKGDGFGKAENVDETTVLKWLEEGKVEAWEKGVA